MPSRWVEDAGHRLPGEDAGHLPNRVLEAQAKKSEAREPLCPQGVILKEEQREEERKGKKE